MSYLLYLIFRCDGKFGKFTRSEHSHGGAVSVDSAEGGSGGCTPELCPIKLAVDGGMEPAFATARHIATIPGTL